MPRGLDNGPENGSNAGTGWNPTAFAVNCVLSLIVLCVFSHIFFQIPSSSKKGKTSKS
ncbi:hypothetical protein L873DRAFT_1806884 [Choiromyces venosus 120613-1]|uniref:Uncharacterized protein n=1 Tax=Choiromyces venosus 120613-1 TaxID=1336337 RepID=A0A3N4JR79_9PEZI|nr:hypothetical protein L873DRAFT_1806884 [Choiromyces venosus 120613-1]